MDFGGEMFDFAKITGGKKSIENITPHKIAVVAFIREFCILKREAKELDISENTMAPKCRKDFCMLALKLIQCPDMEFKDLELLLTSGKYFLLNAHVQNFCSRLQQIYDSGIGELMDCVSNTVDKLMIEPHETSLCQISRSSVLGLYLRRMMLYLDKMPFSQVTAVYRTFCMYYEKGRPGFLFRCASKEKLNICENKAPLDAEEASFHMNFKRVNIDRDSGLDRLQWSRKQAELFTAQQAQLLQINEPKALSPPQLQNVLANIIRDNPDYAEAHFLSFMNCLRVREFCGAQEALYSCFDRSYSGAPTGDSHRNERKKNFRYAALNLAVLYAQFGYKELAQSALSEAMVLCQEAGDGAGLQHVLSWLVALAGGSARGALLARANVAPQAQRAAGAPPSTAAPAASSHRTAAAAQAAAQHAAVNATKPANIFNLMIKSDVIHCQHSMTDLVLTSLANRAALWSLYGKTEMSSVCCQLLLNLNTSSGAPLSTYHSGMSAALGAAGAAGAAWLRGEAGVAAAVLAHARRRFPHAPLAAPWTRVSHTALCVAALHAGKWQDAEQSINQLASIDRWESQLLKAELYFLKGEPVLAMECLHDVLLYCKTEDDSQHCVPLKVRAMVLKAQVQNSYSDIYSVSSSSILLLNEALTLSRTFHLHYLAAGVEMQVANVQLQLGCTTSALQIVRRVLPTIMAHGGPYDMGRAMLLFVKCRMAVAPAAGPRRSAVLSSCCATLHQVRGYFSKVEAHARLKDAIYLQAQLYNEAGDLCERNKCALQYRQLDQQCPTKLSNTLLTCF